MRDPWLLRCPKGHSSIESYGSSYRCRACELVYDEGPFDARETEFPVENVAARAKSSREEVLRTLVSTCDEPGRSVARASELGLSGSNRQIGRMLSSLCADGLVRKMTNESRGHHWQPTDAGRQRVTGHDHVLEGGSERGRAQASPATLVGLATVFVGLVLITGWALATCGGGL